MRRPFFIHFLILLLVFWLFFDPLRSFFSQDDFFHIRQIMDKPLNDFFSLFSPFNELGYAFYRPLSREFYYFIMFNLFSLNPLPYHLVNLFLIVINSYLILKFAAIFKQDKPIIRIVARLSSFLYLINSVHSIEIYYLSSVQTLISTTFILLGLIHYFKNKLLSIIFFIFAICSHESAIVFIPLLLVLELLFTKKLEWALIKKISLNLFPFFVVLLVRMLIFLAQTGLPQQEVYQPTLSLKSIINSLGWYILWSFSVPEVLVDFVGPKLVINQNFLRWYKEYVFIAFPLLLFIVVNLITFIVILRKFILKKISFIFYILAFIISVGPFLFFPQHKFVYYLSLPLIWFSLGIGQILGYIWISKKILRLMVVLIIISFTILSYQTTALNKITHWSAKRDFAAKTLLADIKKNNPNPKKGTIFYIKDDPNYPFISKEWGTSSKQAFYILSGSDGLQLTFNDPLIKVYYQSIGGLPSDINEKEVISITAKFPY